MSWFLETRRIVSEKNPDLRCYRVLGNWNIHVGNSVQNGTYMNDLWRDLLTHRLPKDLNVKRILLLGLGTGSTIPLYRRRFPHAHITAIEWDPKMVELMDELYHFPPSMRPEVLIGDAQSILPELSGSFDLITSDLFEGPQVSPLTSAQIYLAQLHRLLKPYGYLMVNVYAQPEILAAFSQTFAQVKIWKNISNWFGIFRHHGAGVMGDSPPAEFVRYDSSPAYLKREFADWQRFGLAQCDNLMGVEVRFGPLHIEQFFGDEEPQCRPNDRTRWIIWYPTSRIDKPAGWHRSPVYNYRRKTGFSQITAGEDYWKSWSEPAQRQRIAWKKQTSHLLEGVSVEEYVKTYHHSGMKPTIVHLFAQAVERKAKAHGERLHLFGIRERETRRLVAGFAALDIPEHQLSYHVTSFILPEARKTPAGVAMVDEWFGASQRRGIRFLDFDGFWAPGDPVSWKGFSQFKGQFNVQYILYPKPLMRWMRAKKC